MFAYPVFLDVTACRVLVVGAGSVAARKVRGLLEAGATQIIVVSPEFSADMPSSVTRVHRGFDESDLDDIGLCFAATDLPAVNERVCELCHARGIPVNRADHDAGAGSSFTVPAIARAGNLAVAVSAGGSPAIAARLRDVIAERVLPGWAAFADAASQIRQAVLALGTLSPPVRQAVFRTLASEDAQAAYMQGGISALRGLLVERHPEMGTMTW